MPQSGEIVGILKNMKDVMDKSLGGIVADEEAATTAAPAEQEAGAAGGWKRLVRIAGYAAVIATSSSGPNASEDMTNVARTLADADDMIDDQLQQLADEDKVGFIRANQEGLTRESISITGAENRSGNRPGFD